LSEPIQSQRESRYTIEAVIKTLQVLFAFRTPPHRFTSAEIESNVRMSKNQVFRSLKSLEDFGLLRMEPSGHYRVTPLIFQLTAAADLDTPLEEIALPVMEHLQAATDETVNLCSLIDGQAVIVARKDSKHAVRLSTKLGQRTSLHAGASPKAMLAFLPVEEQERVLSMLPVLPRYTQRTISNSDELRLELQRIRNCGYSISDEDVEEGARGVGAPIFGPRGEVVGAISVGGPVSRVSYDKIEYFAEQVVKAARKISRMLGYMERQTTSFDGE
jgi:DNA-binding IclR family transcriptional regulator